MTKIKTTLAVCLALLATASFAENSQRKTAFDPEARPRVAPAVDETRRHARERDAWPPDMAPYDHEYTGELTIKRGTDAEVRAACPNKFTPNGLALGCTIRRFGGATCEIWIANDARLQAVGWARDYDIILRHELSHCNGWNHLKPGEGRNVTCFATSCE